MRHWNWVHRLNTAIETAAKTPFDYGGYNCGLFAAECIDAMVDGATRVTELQSQFSDEASAKAFVDRYGGIEAAVTKRLGEPSEKWSAARRGDVCLVMTQDGPGLGVCMGVMIAMMAPKGLTHARIDQALKVWRID